jgi:hypothetical protein
MSARVRNAESLGFGVVRRNFAPTIRLYLGIVRAWWRE